MAAAQFLGWDYVSQGDWVGRLGGEGWCMLNYTTTFVLTQQLPANISSIVVAGASMYADAASDSRAIQMPPSVGGRKATQWYSNTSFTMAITTTDNTPHLLSVYGCVFANATRRSRYRLLDPGNGDAVLTSQDMPRENATAGAWGRFLFSGSVTLSVSAVSGINPAVNGLLFDAWSGSIGGDTVGHSIA